MVKLNTTYDKSLKQKIFVLKGDEAYARTTDVLADVISDFDDCNTHIRYCRVGLEIDVLREIGDGFVNVYDNDTLLHSIEWGEDMDSIINNEYYNGKGIFWNEGKLVIGASEDYEIGGETYLASDTGLFLDYDVVHNLQVKYTGNKQCLASKSEIIEFIQEKPDIFNSSISFEDTPINAHVINSTGKGTLAMRVLLNTDESATVEDKTIKILDGQTVINTATVKPNITSIISLTDLSAGLHTFRVIFDGDDEVGSTENTIQVSMGYQVEIIDYPTHVFNGQDIIFSARVTDYFGTTVPNVEVDSFGDVTATTNSNGIATLTLPQSVWSDNLGNNPYADANSIGLEAFYYVNSGCYYYSSPRCYEFNAPLCNYYSNAVIQLPSDMTICDGSVLETTGRVVTSSSNPYGIGNVPVTLSGAVTRTTVTNENGYFTISYTGNGGGDVTVSASSDGLTTATATIEDVISYWDVNGTTCNQDYSLNLGMIITETSTGWTIRNTDNSNYPSISFRTVESNIRYSLSFVAKSSATIWLTNPEKTVSVSPNDVVEVIVSKTNSDKYAYFIGLNGVNVANEIKSSYEYVKLGLNPRGVFTFNKLKIKRI